MRRKKGLPAGSYPDPEYDFFHDGSAISIRNGSLYIIGDTEDAYIALAEHLLALRDIDRRVPYVSTVGCLKIIYDGENTTINLEYPHAMPNEGWLRLKKSVESICNNLAAFL